MNFRLITTIIASIFLISGCQNTVGGIAPQIEDNVSQIDESEVIKASLDVVEPTESGGIVMGVATSTEVVIEPDFALHEVSFGSQAPYAVWDELHQESCEEASMIMVDQYFKQESFSVHTFEQAILNLAKWEENKGYGVDLTAQETYEILNDYFGLKAKIITDVNVDVIKKEILSGNLIIVPAAGRELGNPYFQTPGPIYHMLVIKGYDDTAGEFITNDPGTKRGESFRYKYQVLLNAIHDWSHKRAEDGMTDQEIAQGSQIIISVDN